MIQVQAIRLHDSQNHGSLATSVLAFRNLAIDSWIYIEAVDEREELRRGGNIVARVRYFDAEWNF